ncbi:MAG: sigma-70 family RNA polymerase sigma factor [Deltaproteobacteria bacterium]|nr:sigma-70 family RNA polymerase sigma factor [Deltaproteobacteria bacterium]
MPVDVEEYYRRYGPMVLRRCRSLLKREELAVDAMQDTFVQVLRHLEQLEGTAPSSLLYRIATNVCLNRIRTQRRHPEDADDDLLGRIAALDESEPRVLARNLIDRLFARDPVSTREIALLHLVDGLTLEEVAGEVGLSVSGVRKRLRPLKDRLAGLAGV